MWKKRFMMAARIVVCLAMLGAAAAFLYNSKEYFSNEFGRKTFISNTDVSSMTVDEAVAVMNASEGFSVEFSKDGVVQDIDISAAVTREFSREEITQCRESVTFQEYLFGSEKDYQVKPAHSVVDEPKLREILEQTLPAATAKSEDAYINEEFQLVPEVFGDEVNFDRLIADIKEGIGTGLKLDYALEDYYIKPNYTKESEDIVKVAEEINAYSNLKIEYEFGEEKEVIDWEKIKKYLKYDQKNVKLTLKTKWVEGFVENLSKTYNTYGKTRKFKSTKDGTKEIRGGTLGWWINQTETVKQLKKLLRQKKSKSLDPVYYSVAVQHGKDDVGTTYVEVSIDRQHVWYYKDGKLKMESDCVTGKLTKDRRTIAGVHRLYAKQRDRYLGTIAVQGYRSFVHYWMPFNLGQGLHDASWRSKFGGKIYKSGGSHGCVNLPSSFAGKLYEQLEVGTPVVVY